MWSDQYNYFNIYKNKSLADSFPTKDLVEFLSTLNVLEEVEPFQFKNVSNFPFIRVFLLKAPQIDSWSSKDVDPEQTNLINIVCSKNEEDFKAIKPLLNQMASFLNWQLADESESESHI